MATDTLAIFDGLALTAEQMRRAIRAYARAEVIWEWRTGPEDEPARELPDGDEGGAPAAIVYRAVVTATCADGATVPLLGRGATRAEALGDLLWQLALAALLGDEGEPARPHSHLTLLSRG